MSDNYYAVLGLSPSAPAELIRTTYYGLCKKLHPDKADQTDRSGNQDRRSALRAVQCAYSVLSDASKRVRYDIRNGFYNHGDKQAKLVEVERVQKEKAQRATQMMGSKYKEVYKREVERHGVLIKKSWYGNFRLKQALLDTGYTGPVTEEHVEGPWIDVSIPVQCQVSNSRLIIPGGPSSSKTDIDGFYNPTASVDSMDLCLYVLYRFQGDIHEVTVTDKQPLAIPLKSHKLTALPSGPFDPANLSSRRPDFERSDLEEEPNALNMVNCPSPDLSSLQPDFEERCPSLTAPTVGWVRLVAHRTTYVISLIWIPLTATVIWTSAYMFFNYYDRQAVLDSASTFLNVFVPRRADLLYERMYSTYNLVHATCANLLQPVYTHIQPAVELVHTAVARVEPFLSRYILSSAPALLLSSYVTCVWSTITRSLHLYVDPTLSAVRRVCWDDISAAIYNLTAYLLPPQPSSATVGTVNGVLCTNQVRATWECLHRGSSWLPKRYATAHV
eukprot:GHVS01055522.1.p1 GENE.GHVS01055522.1~~GHVS01055522.1.p1  ORF type:complete len:529 (+),score=70.93 GHVS01055522.1:86-1588(+)